VEEIILAALRLNYFKTGFLKIFLFCDSGVELILIFHSRHNEAYSLSLDCVIAMNRQQQGPIDSEL
jgi:hypothetical protein